MKIKTSTYVLLAAFSCLAACIGDFAVTFLIGAWYKNYNFLDQTQSYLGISKSPVSVYMNAWGVIFGLLFVLCAYALRKSVFAKGRWQLAAVWLIAIFGLGEGAGSGLFPYDHIAGQLTWSAKLHTIFSAIGDIAMVLLPFVLLKIFTRQHFPKLSTYAWFVAITGPLLIMIFLLARADVLPMRGLWQRLFLLDYYSLLMVMAMDMLVTNSGRSWRR